MAASNRDENTRKKADVKEIRSLEQIALQSLMRDGVLKFRKSVFTYPDTEVNLRDARIHPQLRQKIFLQAVIDDHRATVKKLLAQYPELLIMPPLESLVIQSQYTWQLFYAEKAFTLAAKRKQIVMIKVLLPYFDQLPQTEEVSQAKAEGLAAWTQYKTQQNAEGENEIVIPQKYARLAQSLIDVFREENFPNGIPGNRRPDGSTIPMNVRLSERTEDSITAMLNLLVPKTAVKLGSVRAIDPELFLLALYEAYSSDNFYRFQNWDQRHAFCIRASGLAQSALSPETAKFFCEGLYDVIEHNRAIGSRAESLKLFGGEDFYRGLRDSRSGLGFEYLCGVSGGVTAGFMGSRVFPEFCQTKTTEFGRITRRAQQHPADNPGKRRSRSVTRRAQQHPDRRVDEAEVVSRCVIS